MVNVIPPMTDPLGSAWVQPVPEEILVTDTDAVMPEQAFLRLPEYSSTVPTGVYPGKMWRAEQEGKWYLRWYGLVPDRDDLCSNNHRLIQIMDWKAMMGIQEERK